MQRASRRQTAAAGHLRPSECLPVVLCVAAWGLRGVDAATVALPSPPSDHWLWPQTEVRYEVVGGAPADTRVADALAVWAEESSLEFTECVAAADCNLEILIDDADPGCGESTAPNLVIGRACNVSDIARELGRALGFTYEQKRFDRDEFIRIVPDAITPGQYLMGYALAGEGRAFGAYDWDSLMHLPTTAFAKPGREAMVAPVPVGVSAATGGVIDLSPGDIAAVDLLYNDGAANWTRPRCAVSRGTAGAERVPFGKTFRVQFTGVYSGAMNVSFNGTTAPPQGTSYSVLEGSQVAPMSAVVVGYTPRADDAGKTFVIRATFEDAEDAGADPAECEVAVEVLGSITACNGIAGNDPAVCSGQGACDGRDPAQPCVCRDGYSGAWCEVAPAMTPEELVEGNLTVTATNTTNGTATRSDRGTADDDDDHDIPWWGILLIVLGGLCFLVILGVLAMKMAKPAEAVQSEIVTGQVIDPEKHLLMSPLKDNEHVMVPMQEKDNAPEATPPPPVFSTEDAAAADASDAPLASPSRSSPKAVPTFATFGTPRHAGSGGADPLKSAAAKMEPMAAAADPAAADAPASAKQPALDPAGFAPLLLPGGGGAAPSSDPPANALLVAAAPQPVVNRVDSL